MRAHYHFFLPLLSLFITRVELTESYPISFTVKLVKVLDGDTLKVQRGGREFSVRISKIDAPEKGQPFYGRPKSDAGNVSSNCLIKTLAGRKVLNLVFEKLDVYKRVLGDFDDLSYQLVKNGCAGLYPHAVFESRSQKLKYLMALSRAKHLRKGVWAYGGYMLPKNWRKKGRSSSRKRISHRR